MKLIGWGHTDTGRKRTHNEDSFLVDNDHQLFAVADGMGGHRGGATASRMAMDVIGVQVGLAMEDMDRAASSLGRKPAHWGEVQSDKRSRPIVRADLLATPSSTISKDDLAYEPTIEFIVPPAVTVMRSAAERASADIYEASLTDPNLHGMGTTLTALLYHAGSAYIIHAGDSRIYLLRDGVLEQLTEDHTWIAEQIKAGIMTEDEAKASKYRHVITRSVGFEPTVEFDIFGLEVESGDCFLLCSDGMSNHLDNADIEKVMVNAEYRDIPAQLIDMANDRGGDDNITVVAAYAGPLAE